MGDEVGGYQRDHAQTFGVGTINPCRHPVTAILGPYGWHVRSISGLVHAGEHEAPTWAQPDDRVGTTRCLGCGSKVEA